MVNKILDTLRFSLLQLELRLECGLVLIIRRMNVIRVISTMLIAMVFVSAVFAEDQNCFDTSKFTTVPMQCQCILNNTLSNCHQSGVPGVFCNKTALNDLFRADPSLAVVKCEQYAKKDHKKECSRSVAFYRTNQCWKQK